MVLDIPGVAACVVGDGKQGGPWPPPALGEQFINPIRRRRPAVLNLNGYKIANPTILARISQAELEALFVGYG